jgi:glycogen debranching enzyme
VACSPQAWAAATLPAFVQACLGLNFDPASRTVRFDRPILPGFLDRLALRNLSLGDARISVLIRHERSEVSVSVIKRCGDIQVVTAS